MVGLVVVGLVVAGLGVASATVWRPSDTAVMTTGEQSGATLLTTAPGVLSLVDRDVTITARSSDDAQVVLALGSQVDVEGWVGEDPALRVTGASDWETLTVSKVGPGTPEATDAPTDAATDAPADAATEAPADPAATPSAEAGAETDAAAPVAPGPDPSGSDMWVESTSGTGSATLAWDATSTDQVLLVAAVGEDAAAPQLTLSWPREVTTPLLWPGVALGVLLVVLGLIYGILTRGRRRRATAQEVVAAPAPAEPTPAGGTPATGSLTRRQLRELAEREEAEAAAAAAAAPRQKRQWPWTGAIPVVKQTDPTDVAEQDEKPAAAEAHRPAWLSEGTASTSGSSWRAAWGVRTPETDASSTPDTTASGPGAGGPRALGTATAAATSAAAAPAGRGEAAATTGSERPAAPSTPTAPSATAAPSTPTTPTAPAGSAASSARPGSPRPGTPAATPASPSTPAAPSAPSAPSADGTTRPGYRPAPLSSKPASGTSATKPGTSAARPVDPGSPFQRITLRSSDESAPARRIRRDQQQAPSAWSASRSPWAQPARPATDPAGTPRPAPGADGTPSTGTSRTDGTTDPTDDTSKDSD